ncbi:hypothetical protein PR202_gb10001 [Eleusine coracana subsp. coracana]|uniref:Uncharacterized protein n=1 Tax=Eleusine coracana subsp. coracana TaxID=191504 RepID=A0AAV5EJT9_ELECO|nr:hypothetical protein QOZ80_2BG0203170 [Eleusine coracana subsp. coracana]GJN22441.1 hypothetical protein PR202_gb10001 [Eleusine coracana subsp. coracana]
MANVGYYHDLQGGAGAYRHGFSPAPRATSFHLCVFLATAALLGGTSLYSRYESAVETLVDQVRVAVVLSPLLFLLAVQYWAATSRRAASGGGSGLSSLLVARDQPFYDGRGYQRDASSSPWGVALVLALVLLLVSYQSCFQDLWFPLTRRR